ncbi:glucose-1-phosphate adenylyltransferase [Anaerotignum neopropionicum]|uniref:Glucose-1-phosphate adenylyltransferase n=1 Tax=Anaerotignum neopropionicum TaxID=36847 RepID=A0A136WBF5_9FIRM|nr:glucose-1-phosphate adenylyltransferase [Anaerotignum neopropionicum]KXL51825.1 glucose-1-phosphate adenylyltransferase [Anaerotignum neopropionicum]
MRKKEMIAMLLAGGQGSRLGVLTRKVAKPAVAYGGKFRIIDFPLSNCINSGVDTVGVLTQYQPLQLNQHIGIGIPWDLDKKNGGVTILAPHVKGGDSGEWFMGTANAIYQNIDYIDSNNPEYVLILSGDHIYKMDYSKMLAFHKEKGAAATIAVLEVPFEEASRFGIMNTKEDDSIYEFEEKPANPKSNLASMGIYIFTWSRLREALVEDRTVHPDSDFGMHIIPKMLDEGQIMYAYRFKGYWKDVGTIESYWESNMELIKALPAFNLYEDFWKIYTNADHQPPTYTAPEAVVKESLVTDGSEIYGQVYHSVLGAQVIIGKGTIVRDSIIMGKTFIGENAVLERCIVDEDCVVGNGVHMGVGENVPNETKPNIYNTGITVIGSHSKVPDGITIGKNCVIYGDTRAEDYENGKLESGKAVVREGK